MKTTGLTAAEAKAALPGQNINKVCRVYTAPTGTARPLYDLPASAVVEEPKPKKRGRPKKVKEPEAEDKE
jgi:hypothetical protein